MYLNRKELTLAMVERELTYKTLAELSGVSRQTLSAIKAGKTCSPITAGKIAKALGVPLAELMGDVV